METETIVQFVLFETGGDNVEFMSQWDEYSKEMRKVQPIKLQQEIGNKKNSRYLSQHSCYKDDFQFVFKKERRSAHFPEVEMKVRQLGGYITSQIQCKHDSRKDESKIFVFITGFDTDVDIFRQLSYYRFLNIYEAYFESSNYNYILEFFVENSHAEEFMEQLKNQNRRFESGAYKECILQAVK
jgi:hypothetical protein